MPDPIPAPKRKAAPKPKAKPATKRAREDPVPSVLRKAPKQDEPETKRPRGRPRKQPTEPPQVFDMAGNDDDAPAAPKRKTVKKVPVKTVAKALGSDEAPAMPKPRNKSTRPVPEAAPPMKKAPTRKVKIDEKPKNEATLDKKKRGRPPGSRNKKASVAVTKQLEKSMIAAT